MQAGWPRYIVDLDAELIYVCVHEKTRFRSKILENELNADYEITVISGQIAFYFKRLSLSVASQSYFL